jgi:predicted alpha/beta hydrolase family esterase
LPRETVVDAPIMPDPDHPDAAAWGGAVREHMAVIDEDFVAAGHSLGGSTILKEISEHGAPASLRGVVTMAMPFWNAPDWDVPDYAVPEETGPLKDVPLILYASTDDATVAIDHLDRYAALLPNALPRRVSGTDHLFDSAPYDAIAKDIVSLLGERR